jgi:hypothetical protein
MRFRMNDLMGMITGLSQLISYQVGFGSAMRCACASLLGRSAGWLGRVMDSAQMPILNMKSFFFFRSIL